MLTAIIAVVATVLAAVISSLRTLSRRRFTIRSGCGIGSRAACAEGKLVLLSICSAADGLGGTPRCELGPLRSLRLGRGPRALCRGRARLSGGFQAERLRQATPVRAGGRLGSRLAAGLRGLPRRRRCHRRRRGFGLRGWFGAKRFGEAGPGIVRLVVVRHQWCSRGSPGAMRGRERDEGAGTKPARGWPRSRTENPLASRQDTTKPAGASAGSAGAFRGGCRFRAGRFEQACRPDLRAIRMPRIKSSAAGCVRSEL